MRIGKNPFSNRIKIGIRIFFKYFRLCSNRINQFRIIFEFEIIPSQYQKSIFLYNFSNFQTKCAILPQNMPHILRNYSNLSYIQTKIRSNRIEQAIRFVLKIEYFRSENVWNTQRIVLMYNGQGGLAWQSTFTVSISALAVVI